VTDTYEELQQLLDIEYAKLRELNAEMESKDYQLDRGWTEKDIDRRNRARGVVYAAIKALKERWNAIGKEAENAKVRAAGFRVGDRVVYHMVDMITGGLLGSEAAYGTVVMSRGRIVVKLDRPYMDKKTVPLMPGWRKVEK